MTVSKLFLLSLLPLTLAACDQADRTTAKAAKPASTADQTATNVPPEIALVPLAPGGKAPPVRISNEAKQIPNDPEQIAAGKQLFMAMNCVGCHFHGGGGMGPPLMDSKWIYGSSFDNIVATIREGRPNGMPSFRGFLPDEQIWQLAAYVKSLSANADRETPPSPH